MPTAPTRTEFRVTRPERYETDDCPGKDDPSARQGYYIKAQDAHEAAEKCKTFLAKAHDLFDGECRFDVQVWKEPGRCVYAKNAVRIKLMS